MKLSQLLASPSRIAGTWIKFDGEGCEFKLASVTRKEFQIALEKARRDSGVPAFRLGKDSVAQMAIYGDALAEACVIDWKNVEDETGPLQCTPANKKKLLAVPLLREWINSQCSEITNFQEEAVAADAEALKSVSGVEPGVGQE